MMMFDTIPCQQYARLHMQTNLAFTVCYFADPIFVRVRLFGSNATNEGRLEVNVEGLWASVSSQALYALDSTRRSWFVDKACQELGYVRGKWFTGNFFSSGEGPVKWWTSMSCTGSEGSVADCTWTPAGSSGQDANIACSNSSEGW